MRNNFVLLNSLNQFCGNYNKLSGGLYMQLIRKDLESSGILILKGVFFETTYANYLCTKFQVSSIILMTFRQGLILCPLHCKTNP